MQQTKSEFMLDYLEMKIAEHLIERFHYPLTHEPECDALSFLSVIVNKAIQLAKEKYEVLLETNTLNEFVVSEGLDLLDFLELA
jgi:hypothetical protein